MSRYILFCLLLGVQAGHAWISYDDNVERKDPVFGKPFQGYSLSLSSLEVDFEQGTDTPLQLVLKRSADSTKGVPAASGRAPSVVVIVMADTDGATHVSQDLLADRPVAVEDLGKLQPGRTSGFIQISFDALRMAPFKDYHNGLPHVTDQVTRVPASSLVPRVYVLRAILYAAEAGKRPDFAVASDTWPILLRAKRGERMSAAERQSNLERWLRQMSQGAYGGIAVSSQLAALGEEAVGPLIALAERTDSEDPSEAARRALRESRIWAIVTLCNTGSRRAEDYILRKLGDPTDFGDLSFILWHSQGFHSDRVTAALKTFAEDAACGRPMPWEARRGPGTREHGLQALEFAFKHFLSIGTSVTDATVSGLVRLGHAKLATFALMTWAPSSEAVATHTVLPLVTGGPVHGTLKKAVLACLTRIGPPNGLHPYDRDADITVQWLDFCVWLQRSRLVSSAQTTSALCWLALDIPRDQEEAQAATIAALRSLQLPGHPSGTGAVVLPADWVATWRWALQTADIDREAAIAYCTRMMRTRDDLPQAVKEGLLLELKRLLGGDFPLPDSVPFDVDKAWPECGGWLVQNGYFGTKGD